MERQMSYCLILPAGYTTSQRSYPVLYLLHGLFGSENDWTAYTRVAEYVRTLPLIVVMPQADDSWYTNALAEPRNRYEDYVFNDLIKEIDSKYRTQKTRDGRFLAGLSMGGYGAVKAALQYPQRYAMVASFSGAFHITRYPAAFDWITARLAFGLPNAPARITNDDYILLGKADPAQLPYLFITCGSDDRFVGDNRELVGMMSALRVRYEYRELQGNHTWAFWDRSLAAFVNEISQRLPSADSSAPQH
jgi:S-formylglutathione hydrolase FrmB